MRRRAAALVLLPALALAQNSRSDYLRLFDTDGDGRVGEAEYVDYMSQGFQRMDANGDGVLERDELPGGRGHELSRAQYEANLRAQFHRLDRNHDGSLDARELTAPPR